MSVKCFSMPLAAGVALLCLSGLCLPSIAAQPVNKAVHHSATPVNHSTAAHKPVSAKPAVKSAVKPGAKASPKTVIAVRDPNAFIRVYAESQKAYAENRYADAERLAKQALTMAETVNGPQHKNIAIISHFTGLVLDAEGKWPESSRYLKRALAIYSQPGNSQGVEESMLYEKVTLGKDAMILEQYDEARRYLEAALPESAKRYGPDNAETVGIQSTLHDLDQMDTLPDYPQAIGPKVVHWSNPTERPIVVYITDGADVPAWKADNKAIVRDAYAEWQQALSNHIRFEFTEDPEQADTIVSWMEHPKPETHGEKQELALGECTTRFRDKQWLQDNIVLSVKDQKGQPLTADSLHNVVLHEVAHSMGLIGGHSNNPSDVLYPNNKYEGGRRKKPTQRDINTIAHLYGMPAQITEPPNISLSRFARFSDLYQHAGDAFNGKDYTTALNGFQNALAVYPIAPDARFFAGVSAYQLNQYDLATNYLLPLTGQPGDYQGKALHMVGYSLIKSGNIYEQGGFVAQAEQQYNRAVQVLSAGRAIAMSAEDAKALQDQLNWLSQRQTLQSGIATASNTNSPPKKKSKWAWLFDQSPSNVIWVPMPSVPGMRY